jgi:hypothetical protein
MKSIVREAKFSHAFQTGWQLYMENFGLIFGSTILVWLVTGFSCGICAGPMACGLYVILLALLRKRDPVPRVDELFEAGFAKFAPSFVFLLAIGTANVALFLLLSLIPIVGNLASMLLLFAVNGVGSWGVLMIADQNATIGEAFSVFKLLDDGRFWKFILIVFVANLVATAGMLLCCVGQLFTVPLGICVVVAAYEQMVGGSGGVPPPAGFMPPPANPFPPSTPPPPVP